MSLLKIPPHTHELQPLPSSLLITHFRYLFLPFQTHFSSPVQTTLPADSAPFPLYTDSLGPYPPPRTPSYLQPLLIEHHKPLSSLTSITTHCASLQTPSHAVNFSVAAASHRLHATRFYQPIQYLPHTTFYILHFTNQSQCLECNSSTIPY